MEPFFTPERRWPAGQRRLHVYLLPDITDGGDDAVMRLVGQAQRVAGDLTRSVPSEWLHITVASTIDPDIDRDTLTDALADVIGQHEVLRLRMGSAVATGSSIQLDADDVDGGYGLLQHDLVTVLDQHGGGQAGGPPHMAVAYGCGSGDSGPIGSRLRTTCRPPHALMTVHRAYICDVIQDPHDHQGAVYRWGILATVPLRPAVTPWAYRRARSSH